MLGQQEKKNLLNDGNLKMLTKYMKKNKPTES